MPEVLGPRRAGGAWVHTHSTGAVLREAVRVVRAASERHGARLSVTGCHASPARVSSRASQVPVVRCMQGARAEAVSGSARAPTRTTGGGQTGHRRRERVEKSRTSSRSTRASSSSLACNATLRRRSPPTAFSGKTDWRGGPLRAPLTSYFLLLTSYF